MANAWEAGFPPPSHANVGTCGRPLCVCVQGGSKSHPCKVCAFISSCPPTRCLPDVFGLPHPSAPDSRINGRECREPKIHWKGLSLEVWGDGGGRLESLEQKACRRSALSMSPQRHLILACPGEDTGEDGASYGHPGWKRGTYNPVEVYS